MDLNLFKLVFGGIYIMNMGIYYTLYLMYRNKNIKFLIEFYDFMNIL